MKTPAEPDDSAIEHHLRASRRLEDAPEAVIQRATAIWQRQARAAAAPGLLQRIVAALTFDSGAASPLAFGQRSSGGSTRQLLFSAEGHDIDLRVAPGVPPGGGRWVLSGQVLGAEATGSAAVIDAQGQTVSEAPLNELGEFRLAPIAAGRYTVSLRLAGREIALPAIDVPQAG